MKKKKKDIYQEIFDEIGRSEYLLMLQNTPDFIEEIKKYFNQI
jgi:hypothetical protein